MGAAAFELPVTAPTLLFGALLLVALVVPMLAERLRLPGLVGLILAGALLGEDGLGVLARGEVIEVLSTAGLLYVMFIAGLEIDLPLFQAHRREAGLYGLALFAVSALLGLLAGLAFGVGAAAALLMGAMLASHTLVSFPIVSELGLVHRVPVVTALGATLVTDTLALLMLTLVIEGATRGLGWAIGVQLVAALAGLAVLGAVVLPRLGRRLLEGPIHSPFRRLLLVLTLLFVVAGLAKLAGLEAILGAFVAGLGLNHLVNAHKPLLDQVHHTGNALLAPFFFLGTGMQVDPGLLVEAEAWGLGAALLVAVIASKAIVAWFGGLAAGHGLAARGVMFGLTLPQAAATLAVTVAGREAGVFDERIVNAVILVIFVTSILGPVLTRIFARRMATTEGAGPPGPHREERPGDPTQA